MNMSYQEVENTPVEIINAYWTMMLYEDERAEVDAFKAQSKAIHK